MILALFVVWVMLMTFFLQLATTYIYKSYWWSGIEYALVIGFTLFGSMVLGWEWEAKTFFWMTLVSVFIHIAIVDMQYEEIADEMNILVFILGVLGLTTGWGQGTWLSGVLYFGAFCLVLFVTGALGGGDVKMMVGMGFLLGNEVFFSYIMIACWIGMGFAVVRYLQTKDKHAHFPFGPALVGSFFWIEWIEPWVRMTYFM